MDLALTLVRKLKTKEDNFGKWHRGLIPVVVSPIKVLPGNVIDWFREKVIQNYSRLYQLRGMYIDALRDMSAEDLSCFIKGLEDVLKNFHEQLIRFDRYRMYSIDIYAMLSIAIDVYEVFYADKSDASFWDAYRGEKKYDDIESCKMKRPKKKEDCKHRAWGLRSTGRNHDYLLNKINTTFDY